MQSKAFYAALALAMSIAPASANELASSGPSMQVAQTEPSRLYHAEWLIPYRQFQGADATHVAAGAFDEPQQGAAASDVEAATAQVSATLKAKIRAIVAFARAEAARSQEGSQLLRNRIAVRCAVRQIQAKREASLTDTPSLLEPAGVDAETAPVSTTVELCSIKLLQVRRNTPSEPGKHAYSIELPPLDETAP
jgi:hypothetical protein